MYNSCKYRKVQFMKAKIAIIEDDPSIALMYATKLKYEGFEVETAIDGESGIALVLRQRPDLILLDIMMPNMNGAELMNKLSQYPEASKSKVIVLSNIGNPTTAEDMKKLGAVDYLTKSDTTPEKIVERIKAALANGKK